jgi:hypothetical protein
VFIPPGLNNRIIKRSDLLNIIARYQ